MKRSRLLLLGAAPLLLASCTQADFQFRVRNGTDQPWLIRVDAKDKNGTRVRQVAPHSDGLAFAWSGSRDVPIELLNDDCTVAAVFEASTDGRFVVTVKPEIEGTAEPYRFNDLWNDPDIIPTSDCGGIVTY
jgi:hypothetical protein